MITFLAAAAITFAPIVPHGSLDTIAIPAGTDCAYALMDQGYHGDPTDGAEIVYAPRFAVDQLCS